MASSIIGAVLFAQLTGVAMPVGAATQPPITLTFDPCVVGDLTAIRRTVSAELGASVVAAESPRATAIAVTCEATAIRITVDDPTTAKSLARVVELAKEDPRARDRLLALAVAELVNASWIELQRVPARAASVKAQPAQLIVGASAAGASSPVPPPWSVTLVGEALHVMQAPLMLGGGVGVGYNDRSAWGGAFDVTANGSSADFSVGAVSTLLASASAGVTRSHDLGPVSVQFLLGARAGYARLLGRPDLDNADPFAGKVAGFWGGPLFRTDVRWQPGPRAIAPGLGLNAGYAAWGVRGRVPGPESVAMAGLWLSLTASLTWSSSR